MPLRVIDIECATDGAKELLIYVPIGGSIPDQVTCPECLGPTPVLLSMPKVKPWRGVAKKDRFR